MTVASGPVVDVLSAARGRLLQIADAADAELVQIGHRLDELAAAVSARRALRRDARRVLNLLRTMPTAEQRLICDAINSGDSVRLHAIVEDLVEQASATGDDWLGVIAARLRGLLPMLRMSPAVVALIVTRLRTQTVERGSRPAITRPPDRAVPRQAQPARVARCPHGPDLRAVDRTRRPAGTATALRVA